MENIVIDILTVDQFTDEEKALLFDMLRDEVKALQQVIEHHQMLIDMNVDVGLGRHDENRTAKSKELVYKLTLKQHFLRGALNDEGRCDREMRWQVLLEENKNLKAELRLIIEGY